MTMLGRVAINQQATRKAEVYDAMHIRNCITHDIFCTDRGLNVRPYLQAHYRTATVLRKGSSDIRDCAKAYEATEHLLCKPRAQRFTSGTLTCQVRVLGFGV